jgi:CheY-like chemotaxis protein
MTWSGPGFAESPAPPLGPAQLLASTSETITSATSARIDQIVIRPTVVAIELLRADDSAMCAPHAAETGRTLASCPGMTGAQPTIAVLNTSDDVVELLRVLFEQHGFIVISAHLDDIKRGNVDVETFVRQNRPAVVMYDIAPPYDRQWAFMNHIRAMPVFEGIPFVLTSTNPERLRQIVGTDADIREIVGKPYDLDELVVAVKAAMRR